nr:MAG TPA: hypothetical protein [Caudoviricetes sp.]
MLQSLEQVLQLVLWIIPKQPILAMEKPQLLISLTFRI